MQTPPILNTPSRFLACAAALTLAATATAQDGGRIPVRVVNGKLVAACDLSSKYRRIPANLFVDYDAPCGLQLHNKAAHPLRAETDDGQPNAITIHFPDFDVTVPKREHGDEDVLDDFTKYHSHEIGENAVVGTIGSQILDDYHLVFDLRRGTIELRPERERSGETAPQESGSVTVPVTRNAGLTWLPVRYPDGSLAALAIGSSRYDTLLDREIADELGHPAGDLPSLTLVDYDFTDFVALRPAEIVLAHPDGVAGVSGINLLQNFRVEVDHVNRWARFTQVRPAEFPEQDLVFFEAMIEEDPEMVEGFLTQYEDARLAPEAAQLLLDLRLDEGADDRLVHRAIGWVDGTTLEDLRATRALDLMKQLGEDGYPEFVVHAGELGLESGRVDRYPDAVHEIHGKLGEVHMDAGRGKQAWKHLLSAAFGLPEDGMINLNLGRFYESEGRHRRAFSRYVQASIVAESGPQAIAGLQRVQEHLDDAEPFSVDLVERMIEGKILNFGTATRFEPDEENTSNRTVLVEFFTNGDFRFAQGGALGNEGLLSYFRDAPVAFVSYHLPEPALDPLVNPLGLEVAAMRGVGGPTVQVVDGTRQGPGAGRARDREAIFQRMKGLVETRLTRESEYTIEVDGRVVDGVLEGAVTVSGPARGGLRLNVLLAERGVLFPGKSGVVVHKHVARAALLGGAFGQTLRFEGEGDTQELRFEFRQALADVSAQNEAWLDSYMAEGRGATTKMSLQIDPSQVSLVAYLRDASNGEVVQAAQSDARIPEDDG